MFKRANIPTRMQIGNKMMNKEYNHYDQESTQYIHKCIKIIRDDKFGYECKYPIECQCNDDTHQRHNDFIDIGKTLFDASACVLGKINGPTK